MNICCKKENANDDLNAEYNKLGRGREWKNNP